MMHSLIETLFLHRLSKAGLLEKTKITGGGHIELILNRSYVEGTQLLKPAGKSLVVSAPNFSYRRPVKYTIGVQLEYFRIGLCRGVRGIMGGHIEKDKTYHIHDSAGPSHCETGVLFLPEFFDAFLNSRHGISPDEIVQAFNALDKLMPLIPEAAMILKQIGGASFTGDVGNIWIEAKALELVSVVLDWHRRLEAAAVPPLKEHDRLGITEAIRYAEEHFSGPLTLNALARQAAMSIRKFTAIFKTHTGLSAASYVRRLRMDQAMYLLKNTTAPLSDIAGMVGYKHQSRFSTLFREQFGVMPSEFRKKE
jgi:AraC-like DNA-binding protein